MPARFEECGLGAAWKVAFEAIEVMNYEVFCIWPAIYALYLFECDGAKFVILRPSH